MYIEHKWKMGRKEKGKLDILVKEDNETFLMIECKTWGIEYEKERKKMLKDGGQLFSYYTQDKSTKYLCLYASRLNEKSKEIDYENLIVPCDEAWKELNTCKDIVSHWNKNFKDNGIFEDWANAFDVEIKALTRGRLKELTADDSGKIFNQFAEILRHNVVSDKPNAFNKIFNLFLCKIVDEDRNSDDELAFQWLENDTDESLQKRLNDLYRRGMKTYLTKDVTDYSDTDLSEQLFSLSDEMKEKVKDMFTRMRLHKNNEFAFKEVFDEKSFYENAIVVREVVELLQPYQIRYGHKQQFLGDFFELLLSTGIKQEAGQFFTPVPIAKFIISSMPIRELIQNKIKNNEQDFLPKIIDYAAGSGHFLTEAMDEVQNIIESIDHKKFKPSIRKKFTAWENDPFDWAEDYVYGIEADYRLVKTAKVSCFLNGDGLAKVIHGDGLDSFQHSKDYKVALKEYDENNHQDNGQFDILVANPPYSVSAFKNTLKNGENSFNLYNKLTDDSSEIECLFIERAKQLLKVGGWAGIILPSSILSNSGIYTSAREIILKYFNIKAIAEFGSNTFMATGTSTVTLFLERRSSADWKLVRQRIDDFFETPQDITINGIERALSKYVKEVYDDLFLDDYISLVKKTPNEKIKEQELYNDYKSWFDNLSQVKSLKSTKSFKEKEAHDQIKEIDKLFYQYVFLYEKDRILYFLLTYPQKTMLIKSGDKQAEKNFLGYEFSKRRGHEGIKMYRDNNGELTTKLYDDNNHHNKEKVSSYVYGSFLGNDNNIEESLSKNMSSVSLIELIDFKKQNFEKDISIRFKKKVNFKSKWRLFKLKDICSVKIGGTPTRKKTEYYLNGSNLWVSISEMKGNIITNTKEKITNEGVDRSNVKLIKAGTTLVSFKLSIGKTAIAGKELYTNEAIAALELENENEVLNRYLFSIFDARYINLDKDTMNAFGKSLNSALLKEVKIPVPPKKIQEKITSQIDDIEEKRNSIKYQIAQLKKDIYKSTINLTGKFIKLREICIKIGSGATPRGGKSAYQSSGITLIRSQNVYDEGFTEKGLVFINDDQAEKLKNVTIEKEDILFNITGASIARCCIVPENYLPARVNQHVAIIRTNEKALPKYVQMMLISPEYKQQLLDIGEGATSRQAITKKQLEEFKIPLPSLEKQKTIVDEIVKIESQIADLEEELAQIPAKKEAILKKYLE